MSEADYVAFQDFHRATLLAVERIQRDSAMADSEIQKLQNEVSKRIVLRH